MEPPDRQSSGRVVFREVDTVKRQNQLLQIRFFVAIWKACST